MTATTASRPTPKRKAIKKEQSLYASTQSRFATAKVVQNLGSFNGGVQFNFTSDLRTAYGRD